MKRKAIVPLVLGLIVGVFTVKLAVSAIQKARASGKDSAVIMAVRARQDIRAHEKITAEKVELVKTTESVFAPAAERFEEIKDLVGRVTAKGIPEGTPILRAMLSPEGTAPGLQGTIPPGFRAVSVKIDEVTGVAYQLSPGDWVDVIVVMDVTTSLRGRKETIAEVILQHVQVAAIGNTTMSQPSASGPKARAAKSATILVREEDVPKLHLAGTRGKITLAMRGGDDIRKSTPPSATMGDVINQLTGNWTKPKKTNEPGPDKSMRGKRTARLVRQDEPHSVMVFHGSSGSGRNRAVVERIMFESADSPVIMGVAREMPSQNAIGGPAGNRSRLRKAGQNDGSTNRPTGNSADNNLQDS